LRIYDEKAIWLSDLRPAFGEGRFFFEEEWNACTDKAISGSIEGGTKGDESDN